VFGEGFAKAGHLVLSHSPYQHYHSRTIQIADIQETSVCVWFVSMAILGVGIACFAYWTQLDVGRKMLMFAAGYSRETQLQINISRKGSMEALLLIIWIRTLFISLRTGVTGF
jgi:hypothetical protein